MIIVDLILLVLSVVVTSIIPLLLPVTVGIISTTIHMGIGAHIVILFISVGLLAMGLFRYYADEKIVSYIKSKNYNTRKKIVHSKMRHATMGKISTLLKKSHNIYVIWICTGMATWSSIPDIIIIRIVRSKMNIYQWLSAYIIGKLFLYIPIVYGVTFALRMMHKM